MRRRRALASFGSLAVGSALSGCLGLFGDGGSETTPTSVPTTETTTTAREAGEATHGVSFDRIFDVVEDLGADDAGTEPIDSLIDEHYGDGTLLEFPPGRYLVEETHRFDEAVDSFGMVGTGDTRRDVRFVFPKGNETAKDPANHYVLNVRSGRNHVVANLTMEQTRDRVTGVGLILLNEDGLVVSDVEFAGFNPVSGRNPGACLIPSVTSIDGVGTIRNFVCTGGGVQDVYPARKVGILAGVFHVGELRLIGHDIRNMGSHPHYTSNHRGCVRTENCFFKNNDNTNLRISGGRNGGHPRKQSWAKGCTIVVDVDNAKYLPDGEKYQFTRGIKCDYGEGTLIEDTDVVFKSTPSAPYCVGTQFNHGKATFRRLRVRSDVDGVGPLFVAQPNDQPVVLENVSLTGTAGKFYKENAALMINRRDGCVVRDSCVRLTGDSQNGVMIRNSSGCRLENLHVSVPGERTVFRNAKPKVFDLTESGDCPLAKEG